MKKFKTVLRLYFASKLSQDQIAGSLELSKGVVNKYIKKATLAGLSWPLPPECEEDRVLYERLHNKQATSLQRASQLPVSIAFADIHRELKSKGVTLQLLWEEQKAQTPTFISYTHFCLLYRKWKGQQPKSMRQLHKAGDKAFIDYAGPTVSILDPDTGELRTAQIFVGVLGASSYTYIEATWTQQLPDWIGSHRRMFEFWGGVPALLVPDNLKSAVTKSCRYEPDINVTYADFIEYYQTAVLPARPYKPKDKSKAENGVLLVERWVLARLRHHTTFVGLAELNAELARLRTDLNNRPFKKLPGCRRSTFEAIDKPALKPLPVYPYCYIDTKKARAHVDYHIELEGHYYSVPCALVKEIIDLRYTAEHVECWYKGVQVALHVRSYQKGKHTTLVDHMPTAHRKHAEWTTERLLSWAHSIGLDTQAFVHRLIESKRHPEQAYRACLGLLSLAKKFDDSRLEKACHRAILLDLTTVKSVRSMLDHRLEEAPLPEENPTLEHPIKPHTNIRGKHYYQHPSFSRK